jgi:FkbM family methyltransferase
MTPRLYKVLGLARKPRDPIELLRAGLSERLGLFTLVHVGAHFGEERAVYEAMGFTDVLWIEASAEDYRVLVARLALPSDSATRHVAVNAFAADTSGRTLALRRFSNDGASSSIFAATPLLRQVWGVDETGTVEDVMTATVDDVAARNGFLEPDLLVVDVQGAELLVLMGGLSVLGAAKAVIVEVSRKPYYAGGVLYPELRDFLRAQGFAEAHRAPDHGDQLYLRQG